jgi:hypothetical protein
VKDLEEDEEDGNADSGLKEWSVGNFMTRESRENSHRLQG